MNESVQNTGPGAYHVEITIYSPNGPLVHDLLLDNLRVYHDGDEFILRGIQRKTDGTCFKDDKQTRERL